MRKYTQTVAAIALCAPGLWAQNVVTAKSGTIHYVDGQAWRAGVDLKPLKTGEFPALEKGQSLLSGEGRAEVLLTPGVFLRVGPNSEIVLVNNALDDTQVRVTKGSALVEVGEMLKDNHISISTPSYRTEVKKFGLYDFSADPDRVRVYDGRLEVSLTTDSAQARPVVLRKGRELAGAAVVAKKFDSKSVDPLYAWSQNRSSIVASANFAAVQTAGRGGSGNSYRNSLGAWVFVPGLSMFTFLPSRGIYNSVFGYRYFSPTTYYTTFVAPAPVFANTGGYSAERSGGSWNGIGSGSAASSSGSYGSVGATSAPTMSAPAPAASAPARRGD